MIAGIDQVFAQRSGLKSSITIAVHLMQCGNTDSFRVVIERGNFPAGESAESIERIDRHLLHSTLQVVIIRRLRGDLGGGGVGDGFARLGGAGVGVGRGLVDGAVVVGIVRFGQQTIVVVVAVLNRLIDRRVVAGIGCFVQPVADTVFTRLCFQRSIVSWTYRLTIFLYPTPA